MMAIFFIVNPKAGTQSKTPIVMMIREEAKKRGVEVEIASTQYHGHARELATNAVAAGYLNVVVCGGDGTMNEVATALCGTDVRMGIIPMGSGNGLARSLGISMIPRKALEVIWSQNACLIDMVRMGDYKFAGVAGLGFDGLIARQFDQSPQRGLRQYARLVLRALKQRQSFDFEISLDQNQPIRAIALMVNVSNTGQFGNEVYISPISIPDDGTIELTITCDSDFWGIIDFAWKVFRKRTNTSKMVRTFSAHQITIRHKGVPAHLDGEPVEMPEEERFEVVPRSLWVLTPQ